MKIGKLYDAYWSDSPACILEADFAIKVLVTKAM